MERWKMNNYLRVAYNLAALMSHTHWSKKKLEEFQNKRTHEIIKYAYAHVPFYRQKFDKLGLKPNDVKNVHDLNKIPVIRKAELQESGFKLISDEFSINKLRPIATSGSTGIPLVTYLNKVEDDFRKAKILRPHVVCGQKVRDRWALIGLPEESRKIGVLQKFLRVWSPVFISVFDSASNQIASVEKLNPNVLDGYVSSLFLIAKEMQRREASFSRLRFTTGGAEVLDLHTREVLEDVFKVPYYDQYACEELQMMAWQCPVKEGYHIDADSIVMQFLDRHSEEVGEGEQGEIVCTSLFNYAMPLIRYAVNDLGVPSDTPDCKCGRSFPLMKIVEGRKDSIVRLPDGRSLSPLAIGISVCAFKYFKKIVQYRFIQKRLDSFQILVEKRNSEIEDAFLEKELVAHLRRTLRLNDSQAKFEVEFVKEIPLDKTGKFRKVFSEIKE
jgi:phenylacetate-CoA ligase